MSSKLQLQHGMVLELKEDIVYKDKMLGLQRIKKGQCIRISNVDHIVGYSEIQYKGICFCYDDNIERSKIKMRYDKMIECAKKYSLYNGGIRITGYNIYICGCKFKLTKRLLKMVKNVKF